MKRVRPFVVAGLLGGLLILPSAIASAEDISGVISRTLLLSENTRLVGDVICRVNGAACIAFGTPHISLSLNGFTMTGQADSATGCKGISVAGEVGIHTNGQNDVGIRGPGVVRQFQADGIWVVGSTGGQVEGVTTSTNCLSGIRIALTSSQIRVEGNISVRNGNAAAACGGIWVLGSNNSLRWNELSGNGYVTGTATNFGIGVLNGSNNLVEANTCVGNAHGIVIGAAAANTRVEGNLAVGNPPVQVSNSHAPTASSPGVDIWDQAPRGSTTFDRNICVTSINAPCPGAPTGLTPRKPAP